MTIEHVDISAGEIHEPKGITLATSGQLYYANGAGSGAWADETDQIAGITVSRLIDAQSTAASQLPAGLDIPLQIEFGPAVSTTDVSLSAAGALTINTTGTYRIKISVELGRAGGAGTAIMFLRALLNGTQAGRSIVYKISSATATNSFNDEAWLTLPAGTVITYEMVRDSGGSNDGGLYKDSTTVLTWNDSPTAALRVEKFV